MWDYHTALPISSYMDEAFPHNTICQLLVIHTIVYTSLCNISHSSSLHNVSDDKLLDGLVLGNTTSTIGAPNGLGVATDFLGASVIPPFLSLKWIIKMKNIITFSNHHGYGYLYVWLHFNNEYVISPIHKFTHIYPDISGATCAYSAGFSIKEWNVKRPIILYRTYPCQGWIEDENHLRNVRLSYGTSSFIIHGYRPRRVYANSPFLYLLMSVPLFGGTRCSWKEIRSYINKAYVSEMKWAGT